MTYNAALLRALAPGRPVSGEALGRELGMSRAAVWKAVRRLVTLGMDIEALPGRGYRLAGALTLLDASAVRNALPAPVSRRIGRLEVLANTDSSNARILEAAGPLDELAVCLAEYQAAGRGRRGRRWLAPPGGGICLSVGGRLPAAPSDFATLSTAVGIACAGALEASGAGPIRLKWPNDLLLGAGKLGGILIELRGESQGPSTIAVGVGLNIRLGDSVRNEICALGGLPPADLSGKAGAAPDRNVVAAALVTAIVGCLERAPGELADDVLAQWRLRDALLDRVVRIQDAGPERIGIARGLDRSGALLLEEADGVLRRVTAGEASIRTVE
jgi:BirA family transcriptional regulator, biotin operon repressor / biotin---[acetyl-CoA-carboxylase] ligase